RHGARRRLWDAGHPPPRRLHDRAGRGELRDLRHAARRRPARRGHREPRAAADRRPPGRAGQEPLRGARGRDWTMNALTPNPPPTALDAGRVSLTPEQFDRLRDLLASFGGVYLDTTQQRALEGA